nr:MAG TPA: hypothetical protein [Bacteriophage sp.]
MREFYKRKGPNEKNPDESRDMSYTIGMNCCL